jgi:hypothetical protein
MAMLVCVSVFLYVCGCDSFLCFAVILKACRAIPTFVAGQRWWGDREAQVSFVTETCLGFDDLDAIDAYVPSCISHSLCFVWVISLLLPRSNRFPIAGWNAYPLPVVMRFGDASTPTVDELVWLVRALNSIVAYVREHKEAASVPAPSKYVAIDYRNGPGMVPAWDVGVARVALDPILAPEEMNTVLEMVADGTVNRLAVTEGDAEEED